MAHAVLNVRPSRQRSLTLVRIDNRNKDLAIGSMGRTLLLYAPRDEPRHGYFGRATLADVRLDTAHRRFMFLQLREVETFAQSLPLEEIAEQLESLAYRSDGSIIFGHFSTGIRPLLPRDRKAEDRFVASMRESGMGQGETGQPIVQPAPTRLRQTRIVRNMALRDARLRWQVLEHYGSACAICGSNFADAQRGLYEIEVCHLQAIRFGGPDILANALPMCRTHHWAYDVGLFTVTPQGSILVSNRMTPDLRTRFNGRSRAWFPDGALVRPAAQYLLFHRDAVFQP